jgi:hypothetical protein
MPTETERYIIEAIERLDAKHNALLDAISTLVAVQSHDST